MPSRTLTKFLDFQGGCLFEVGLLLGFHHFQWVKSSFCNKTINKNKTWPNIKAYKFQLFIVWFMPRTNNSLFSLCGSLFGYHNSQSTSMSSFLSSKSELSGAASSTFNGVTSANGSIKQEAVRGLLMPGNLVLHDNIDPPLDNESDHLQIHQEPH